MSQIRRILFRLLILASCGLSGLNAFEIDRVILSTNNDPRYIEFWPVVAKVWQAMGIRPTLALIATEDCPIDTSLGDIIRFDPMPDVSEVLQAQAIRLLVPAFFPEDICLISDIDMLPMGSSYFKDWAKSCPEDTFLVYRDWVWADWLKRTSMCYNAAKGKLFADMFGVTSPEDIPHILRKWQNLNWGWETDELVLYASINEWESKGNPVMRLHHAVGPRLDRGGWNIDFDLIDVTSYHDCHCPRPYSENKETIDKIVNALLVHYEKNKY
jgi:hypothetical protein